MWLLLKTNQEESGGLDDAMEKKDGHQQSFSQRHVRDVQYSMLRQNNKNWNHEINFFLFSQ
eukprot:m.42457 g.42457  ORF g.42457 m.42457 type:complete len:61 (+) comp10519_c0_seq1:563-745(+)